MLGTTTRLPCTLLLRRSCSNSTPERGPVSSLSATWRRPSVATESTSWRVTFLSSTMAGQARLRQIATFPLWLRLLAGHVALGHQDCAGGIAERDPGWQLADDLTIDLDLHRLSGGWLEQQVVTSLQAHAGPL